MILGNLTARAQPLRTAIAAALLLALAAGLALGLISPSLSSALTRRPAVRMSAQASDSVHIYGPTELVWATDEDPTPMWLVISDNFTADSVAGWRYVVEMVPGVSGILGASFSVNGQQWVGRGQYGSQTTRLLQEVDATPGSNSYACELRGTPGSSVWVRIVRVKDPTYRVYGRTVLVRPSSSGTPQVQPFSTTAIGGPTYTLHALNGDAANLHRITSGTVSVNGTQVLGNADFGSLVASVERNVNLHAAGMQDTLTVVNSSASGTQGTFWVTATDTTPPTLTVSSPAQETTYTGASNLGFTGRVSDAVPGLVTVPGAGTWATPDSFNLTLALPADGCYPATVTATSASGLGSAVHRVVYRDTHPPDLKLWPSQDTTVTQDHVALDLTWADTTLTVVSVDGVQVGHSGYGRWTTSYALDVGSNGITISAVDMRGHPARIKRLVYRQDTDSARVRDTTATELGRTDLSATDLTPFGTAVQFLHSGSDPVQTGLQAGKLIPGREAVVRGRVTARDFGGLPNVVVSVLGDTSYGQTKTRTDGSFDLVVNGGAPLVLRFSKAGFLEVQRAATPPVQDYAVLDDVAMIGQSGSSTLVNTATSQVVVGRFESDSSGDRRLSLLFAPGTECRVATAAGTTALTRFHVRLKEFTVGMGGMAAMPAALPPSSAYTYCVDMNVTEADTLASGPLPPDISFDRPVVAYVKDFLGLRVGSAMPSGYYDQGLGQWVASETGVVVKVFGVAGGLALLDTNGDGSPDSLAQYGPLGITDTERTQLAELFAPGDSLWRMRVQHFSPRDFNLNVAALAAAGSRLAANGSQPWQLTEGSEATCGCIIDNENRILGETVPVQGTPFTLNYRSNRQPGDVAMRSLRIPLIGATVPTGLRSIRIRVTVAGRAYSYRVEGAELHTNKTFAFTGWDGCDVYGRPVIGSVTATIRVGMDFPPLMTVIAGSSGFGDPSGVPTAAGLALPGERGSVPRTIWSTQRVSIGAPGAASAGLGGWTLSPHHFYDTNGRGGLWLGDGGFRYGYRNFPVIYRYAGSGANSSGANPPQETTPAKFGMPISPADLAFGRDSMLYLTDSGDYQVLGVSPLGYWRRIAGTGQRGGSFTPSMEGMSALAVAIGTPAGLAVGRDGSIYFSDRDLHRVFRVSPYPDLTIHSVAGNGQAGTPANDSLASTQPLDTPWGLAFGVDGSLYVGDYGNHALYRIDTGGRIHRYAGTGQAAGAGSFVEGRADSVALVDIRDIAAGPEGNVYIAEQENHAVRVVTPDGRMSMLVSERTTNLDIRPSGLAVAPDGRLWIASDGGNKSVYRVEENAGLSVIAGGFPALGQFSTQEGSFAAGATFASVGSVALDERGALYAGQAAAGNNANGISRIAPELPGSAGELVFPSEDGHERYVFTATGRHLRTEDAITGLVKLRFGYDTQGQLESITDVNEQVTTIHRTSGVATAIEAPNHQVTQLSMRSTSTGPMLESATNENDEMHQLDYGSGGGGLLQTFTNPLHFTWQYAYTSGEGRLVQENDPAGGGNLFTTATEDDTLRATVRRTAEGRDTRYQVLQYLDGLRRRLINRPEHGTSFVDFEVDSMSKSTPYGEVLLSGSAAGEVTAVRPTRDPVFGWLAPVPNASVTTLPGSGRQRTLQQTRSWSGATFTETSTLNSREFRSVYDTSQHELTLTTPSARTSQVTFDVRGRAIQASAGTLMAPVSMGYDAAGRLTHLGQASRGWRYAYDGRGRLATVTDTLDRVTSYEYDLADRETLVTLPGNRIVRYRYDKNGNLRGLVPPGSSQQHGFDYTAVDLNASYTPPAVPGVSNPATGYTFNLDRQLLDVTRPDGATVHLEYHSTTGQLVTLTTPRGTTSLSWPLTTGQLGSVAAPGGVTVAYGYDGPLLSRETWSGAVSGAVAHDVDIAYAESLQSVLVGADSSGARFGYDADGLLDSITVNTTTETLSRRPEDGLLSGTTVGGLTSTQEYNPYGELSTLSYAWQNGSRFQQELVRDALGRITRITESGIRSRVLDYHYDEAGRLDTVRTDGGVTQALEYDHGLPGNGNRTRFGPAAGDSAHYDAQDRLLSYGAAAYAYTAAGELVRRIAAAGDTLQTTYDALGNLTGARRHLGANDDSLTYLVDGANRRVARTLNGTRTNTWLYQDGLGVVAELDGSGVLLNRYVYGTQAHVPDLLVRAGVTYRLVTDQLGSVRAVVKVSDGTVMQRMDYDAWGVMTDDSAGTFQALGYAGGLEDRATGLVRFGARDYEPGVGRWTCKDPLGFGGGDENMYAYVGSNPSDDADPEGEYRKKDCSERLEDLIAAAKNLNSRLRETAANCPDAGHDRSINQAWRTYKDARDKYDRHCGPPPPGIGVDLILVTALEAATQRWPHLEWSLIGGHLPLGPGLPGRPVPMGPPAGYPPLLPLPVP